MLMISYIRYFASAAFHADADFSALMLLPYMIFIAAFAMPAAFRHYYYYSY